MPLKLRVKAVDPKKGGPPIEDGTFISQGRTPLDDTADVRDAIAGLVGRRHTTLGDVDAQNQFMRLKKLVGDEQAKKVMNHIFVFNSRPELKAMPVEGRIKTFYDTPAADEDTGGLINKVKAFGYGVIPGFRESNQQANQILANRNDLLSGGGGTISPKVKLKIAGKL